MRSYAKVCGSMSTFTTSCDQPSIQMTDLAYQCILSGTLFVLETGHPQTTEPASIGGDDRGEKNRLIRETKALAVVEREVP